MKISFRQGIVQYQQPTFLSVGVTTVDLLVTDTPTIIAFADGIKDYLYVEQETVTDAWGPILAATDQWLYWDIDRRTGTRTFGITFLEPVAQPTAPLSPANDQHWFDTSVNQMKVWSSSGSRWLEKIRVFACELSNGSVAISMSANSPDFDGTQAGIITQVYAGPIVYDVETGLPLSTPTKFFLTTEDELTTQSVANSNIKLAALIISGEAQQNLAVYTVVTFSDFGRIVAANAFTSQQEGRFGIIQDSALIGDLISVVTEGAVTNPDWDFSVAGGGIGINDFVRFPAPLDVNAPLYSNATGQLTSVEPIPNAAPVATVVDVDTIVVGTPSTTFTTIINPDPPLATEITPGLVRLHIPPSATTAGYQNLTVSPARLGTNVPAVGGAGTNYDFTVNIDGAGAADFTVNIAATDDYDGIATKVDAVIGGSGAAAVFTGSAFVITSDSTTFPSTILVTRPTTGANPDLFAAIETADTVTITSETPVDGLFDPVVVGENDPRWTYLNNVTSDVQAQLDAKVDLAGDTMTGFLFLNADPTDPLHAATMQYVDAEIVAAVAAAPYVELAGDTMTGFLTLNADPTDPLHAATKQYVDTVAGGGGGTPGGADTQIQYNDAGSFGGDADFTYVAATGAFYVNSVDGQVGSVSVATPGGVGVFAASATVTADGGEIIITSGAGADTGDGGEINITSGDGGEDGNGGDISIIGGNGGNTTGSGGSVSLSSGQGITDGSGGSVTLTAQEGVGTGDGGTIVLHARGSGAGGTPGQISMRTEGGRARYDSGGFAGSGDAQTGLYVVRTETTDATVTEMFLDGTGGSRRMTLLDDSTWRFEIHVVARRTDVDDESAAYEIKGCIDRNTGVATTAIVGSVSVNVTAEDTPAWDVTVDADTTNGSLRVQVTGENAKTIRWVAFVRTVEVTG